MKAAQDIFGIADRAIKANTDASLIESLSVTLTAAQTALEGAEEVYQTIKNQFDLQDSIA